MKKSGFTGMTLVIFERFHGYKRHYFSRYFFEYLNQIKCVNKFCKLIVNKVKKIIKQRLKI